MKYSLRVEAIGDDTYQYTRLVKNILNSGAPGLGSTLTEGISRPYWVAKIIGYHPVYKYARMFLKAKKDYTHANSKGSRGVYLFYILESGYIYEVSAPLTWKRIDRYFCTVTNDGEIIRVNKEYVDQWVKDHSASTLLKPQNKE